MSTAVTSRCDQRRCVLRNLRAPPRPLKVEVRPSPLRSSASYSSQVDEPPPAAGVSSAPASSAAVSAAALDSVGRNCRYRCVLVTITSPTRVSAGMMQLTWRRRSRTSRPRPPATSGPWPGAVLSRRSMRLSVTSWCTSSAAPSSRSISRSFSSPPLPPGPSAPAATALPGSGFDTKPTTSSPPPSPASTTPQASSSASAAAAASAWVTSRM
mmetsp:Transcript_41716/g.130687  ORF Transcript_41716/g.130687 Transcript_41716/m.130687 type:complete len:212 (-) Transcript_41716:149-784(-)